VVLLSNILRRAVEDKRNKIIEKLIRLNVYKKEDQNLYDLTLSELEREYKRFQANSHPHDNIESI
jgi:hypothetical protein